MNVPDHTNVPSEPGFMIPHAARIRREADIATTTSWLITEPEQAESAIRKEQLDMVTLAREMLRDPYWPYHAADQLGVAMAGDILPVQYARAV